MRLIDTHCHLDFPELAKDRAGVFWPEPPPRASRA